MDNYYSLDEERHRGAVDVEFNFEFGNSDLKHIVTTRILHKPRNSFWDRWYTNAEPNQLLCCSFCISIWRTIAGCSMSIYVDWLSSVDYNNHRIRPQIIWRECGKHIMKRTDNELEELWMGCWSIGGDCDDLNYEIIASQQLKSISNASVWVCFAAGPSPLACKRANFLIKMNKASECNSFECIDWACTIRRDVWNGRARQHSGGENKWND